MSMNKSFEEHKNRRIQELHKRIFEFMSKERKKE